MIPLVTTRFDNNTWRENINYREKNNIKGSIYGVPQQMCQKIDLDALVFVIEMNNQKNQIEGIGLIKNKYETNRYYKVHNDGNTNRFTYIGKYFIDRETLDDYNAELVYVLDELLFKGYTHSKRGAGLTTIPEKVLKSDFCGEVNIKKDIKDIFIYHFRNKL